MKQKISYAIMYVKNWLLKMKQKLFVESKVAKWFSNKINSFIDTYDFSVSKNKVFKATKDGLEVFFADYQGVFVVFSQFTVKKILGQTRTCINPDSQYYFFDKSVDSSLELENYIEYIKQYKPELCILLDNHE